LHLVAWSEIYSSLSIALTLFLRL